MSRPVGSPAPVAAGVTAAVAATLFWASAAVLGKSIRAPTLVMLTWREIFAVSALGIFVLTTRHRFSAAELWASAPAAVLFAFHVIIFFASIQLTSVAIVVLIYALAPLLIMPLAAWQFGERPTPLVLLLALVSVGGIALVVANSDDHGSNPRLGVLISIVNVMAWVAFTFASKRVRSRGVATLTWLVVANVGALVFTSLGMVLGGHSLGQMHSGDWWRVVALALVPGLVGHALMVWAYRSIDVSLASVIAIGEPVLGTAGAALFLGESLRPLQVVGVVVVCAAVGVVVLVGSRSRGPSRVRREPKISR